VTLQCHRVDIHWVRSGYLQLTVGLKLSIFCVHYFIKPQLAITRAPLHVDAVYLFVRLFVAKMRTVVRKTRFFKKISNHTCGLC